MKKVYLIKENEHSTYKIGVSINPEKRLKQLQTGNSSELSLIHSYPSTYANKIEKTLQRKYSLEKTNGEWFQLSLENELQFLEECANIEGTFNLLIEAGNKFI
jgi:predicted GIY-YIG superfamily endonuclease